MYVKLRIIKIQSYYYKEKVIKNNKTFPLLINLNNINKIYYNDMFHCLR